MTSKTKLTPSNHITLNLESCIEHFLTVSATGYSQLLTSDPSPFVTYFSLSSVLHPSVTHEAPPPISYSVLPSPSSPSTPKPPTVTVGALQ